MMEVFNFFWIIIDQESKKCNVSLCKDISRVLNTPDMDFEKPFNRLSYLYKYASLNVNFFRKCFEEFVSSAPNALTIIDNICSKANLNICSLSTGPGIDYVGLLFSLGQIGKKLNGPVHFKAINKYGAWRSVVNTMITSPMLCIPDKSTCSLVQCDVLKKFSEKAESYLKGADVLLLCFTFISKQATNPVVNKVIKDITKLLKPTALVFVVSNEENLTYVEELDSKGIFLFKPTKITLSSMPYNGKIVDFIKIKPLSAGEAFFAVWQKSTRVNTTAKEKYRIRTISSVSADTDSIYSGKKIRESVKISSDNSKTEVNYLLTSHKDMANDNNFSKEEIKKTPSVSETRSSASKTEISTAAKYVENTADKGNSIISLTKSIGELITAVENFVTVENNLRKYKDSFLKKKHCCQCSSCCHCCCFYKN